MIKKLFQKFGIYLSDRQSRIIKSVLVALASIVVVLVFLGFTQIQCQLPQDHLVDLKLVQISCVETDTHNPPATATLVIGAIIYVVMIISILAMLARGIIYLFRSAFNKKFRESEMKQSVNYIEQDEREQFNVMRATRRAYMILNFSLLIAWLVSLVLGDINAAFWFFIIQAIGALSFRRALQASRDPKMSN